MPSRWTIPFRLLAAVVLLAAVGIWLAGNVWAGRQCVEGGAGRDLLGGREGSIQIVDGACRAVANDGTVHSEPLSTWDSDGLAAATAVIGGVLLVGSVATSRSRKPAESA